MFKTKSEVVSRCGKPKMQRKMHNLHSKIEKNSGKEPRAQT